MKANRRRKKKEGIIAEMKQRIEKHNARAAVKIIKALFPSDIDAVQALAKEAKGREADRALRCFSMRTDLPVETKAEGNYWWRGHLLHKEHIVAAVETVPSNVPTKYKDVISKEVLDHLRTGEPSKDGFLPCPAQDQGKEDLQLATARDDAQAEKRFNKCMEKYFVATKQKYPSKAADETRM